jgi:hypothetical protein
MIRTICYTAALALLATAALAQVEAKQAEPDEVAALEKGPGALGDVEIGNPMLLEVPLGRVAGRKSLAELERGQFWFTTETARFVCDRARLVRISAERLKNRKTDAVFRFDLMLLSGWYRQDIDLTATVVDQAGRVRARLHKDDLSIGNGGGPYSAGTKKPDFELVVPEAELEKLFDPKAPATLKVIVEIQGEEGDSDDD